MKNNIFGQVISASSNPKFNIKGGSKETILIFAFEFGCADTVPENNNGFPYYNGTLSYLKRAL